MCRFSNSCQLASVNNQTATAVPASVTSAPTVTSREVVEEVSRSRLVWRANGSLEDDEGDAQPVAERLQCDNPEHFVAQQDAGEYEKQDPGNLQAAGEQLGCDTQQQDGGYRRD